MRRTTLGLGLLLQVQVHLPVELLDGTWGEVPPDAQLTLSAPGMEPLHVPLKLPARIRDTRCAREPKPTELPLTND